jgi:hypothetical protein
LWVAFTYTDGDGNCNSNCDRNAYSNASTEGYAHTTATSHAKASAVSVGVMRSFLPELAKQFAEFPKSRELFIFRARQAKDKAGTRCPPRTARGIGKRS